MAIPDFRGYVNLTLFDMQPQEIYETSVLNIRTDIPEWIPREGQIEVLLLEAFAFEVAEAVYAINRLPNSIMQTLMLLYGVQRDVGQQPSAQIRFEVNDTYGHTILKGARLLLKLTDGVSPVVFSTVEELIIPPGQTSGIVTATGNRYTQAANGTAADTPVTLMDQYVFVDAAYIDEDIDDGRDQENDIDWIQRGSQRLVRLSDALVLPPQFAAVALESFEVTRALALDNYDGVGASVGSDAGHITVAVYGNNQLVPAPVKTAILNEMDSRAQSSLAVHVIDATLTTVNVTAEIVVTPGYTDALAISNATAAVRALLSTDNWDWSSTVSRNRIVNAIGRADGVDFVSDLIAPASPVSLSGYAPLAVAGTVTITAVTV